MIDQWFNKDVQNILDVHPVAVFIDSSGEADFLLKTLGNDVTVYHANSDIEELHVKYLIEREQPTKKKFLIYTRSERKHLKFIREYCETNGCLEILYLHNYVKDKVHRTMNLNINLPKEDLIAAAKVSVKKNRSYWMDLGHKGATEIFDLRKELLPFIHNPDLYVSENFDPQLRESFFRKVSELIGQDYISKPAKTLAIEVVKTMLDGLAADKCIKVLESVYKQWLDSMSFSDSFKSYLGTYSLPSNLNVWSVNIHHPFRQIDEKWLADIGSDLVLKNDSTEKILKIKQRHQSKQAKALGITFWGDVVSLMEFDTKDISYLGSFGECVEFYQKHFCLLDTAIRNLYTEFLNKKDLLEPFQTLYKEQVSVFMDQWFKHWNGYRETQTGILQRIIDECNEKTAVIVGDGVSYEIAEQVAKKLSGSFTLDKKCILADIPSETENNMSRIYMSSGVVEPIQNNREKFLVEQNPGVAIDFIQLDSVNEDAKPGQVLICTYKDVDDMGEKLQQKALKYFSETIDYFAVKISVLLDSGYVRVYLISDHGFLLAGLLSESDKISVNLKGEYDKAERYIRTQDKQSDLTVNLIEIEKKYKQFNYLYFARNINPFKTPGVYGFSHGGVSPQELITPFFCWERSKTGVASLSIIIENKSDLKDITGELFPIKLCAKKDAEDLFSMERKVFLVFFANKKQVNKSDVFTIKSNETITKEYAFDGETEIEVQLLDATTKQQIDSAAVKQNKVRDLGGLF